MILNGYDAVVGEYIQVDTKASLWANWGPGLSEELEIGLSGSPIPALAGLGDRGGLPFPLVGTRTLREGRAGWSSSRRGAPRQRAPSACPTPARTKRVPHSSAHQARAPLQRAPSACPTPARTRRVLHAMLTAPGTNAAGPVLGARGAGPRGGWRTSLPYLSALNAPHL